MDGFEVKLHFFLNGLSDIYCMIRNYAVVFELLLQNDLESNNYDVCGYQIKLDMDVRTTMETYSLTSQKQKLMIKIYEKFIDKIFDRLKMFDCESYREFMDDVLEECINSVSQLRQLKNNVTSLLTCYMHRPQRNIIAISVTTLILTAKNRRKHIRSSFKLAQIPYTKYFQEIKQIRNIYDKTGCIILANSEHLCLNVDKITYDVLYDLLPTEFVF